MRLLIMQSLMRPQQTCLVQPRALTLQLSLIFMRLHARGRRGVLPVPASGGSGGAEHPADTFLDMHGWGKVLPL